MADIVAPKDSRKLTDVESTGGGFSSSTYTAFRSADSDLPPRPTKKPLVDKEKIHGGIGDMPEVVQRAEKI